MELTIQNVENLTLDGTASGVEDAVQSLIAQTDTMFQQGDPVMWDRDGQTWRGVVTAVSTEGSYDAAIDGDYTVEASEDDPAYLITVFTENADGDGPEWTNTEQMGGARESALSAWDVDTDMLDDAPGLNASAAASDGADSPFRASVSGAAPDDSDDLRGVVWAAGDHTLYLNGEPTPVHVPEDSLQRTFDNVQASVKAGEPPTIGLDHGDSLHEDTVPVASELDILSIGTATAFDLSEDGTALVMTDYELDDPKAVDAAENGLFGNKDYSIVGDLRIHTNEDGTPKTVQSGGKERLVVTAENVRKVDVVKTGAVSGAGPGNMPPLQTAASLAAANPSERATTLTASLRFMAKQSRERDMKSLNELQDVDDPDTVLEGAAEVVEHKDEQIQRLRAVASAAGVDVDEDADTDELTERAEAVAERANAAESLADFHDVDLNAEDGVQALVDEHTADLRHEVAAKEAKLPKYDTTDDTVDDRAAELCGSSPGELKAMNGERSTEILESESARKEYNKAFASGDGADGDVGGSSSGAGDKDVEAVAKSAMTVDEKLEFKSSDHDSAAEFMAERYDTDPADFVGEDNPASAFVAATAGKTGEQ